MGQHRVVVGQARQQPAHGQVDPPRLGPVEAVVPEVGADRAARFLVGAARKGWRDDFTLHLATINDLPGVIIEGPEGTIQTTAFEIEDGLIGAVYVVRNPDKLRHLAARA